MRYKRTGGFIMLNISSLRAILEGRLLAPVARMGLAPLLYALNIGRAAEDVTIGSFAQPTPFFTKTELAFV